MVSRRGLTGLVVVAAALLVAGAAPAAPRPVPGEQAAFAAVRKAARAGRLDAASANADRQEIARAVHLVRVLPFERRLYVEDALAQVGAIGDRLTQPRAVALIGQLRANDDWFAKHPAPAASTDITDADGIVYRFFSGRCFEFHPLANFAALNAHVAAKDVAGTERLADALIARGVPLRGGATGWEYYFGWEGGRPPWTSGMAEAVAAQAFSRAAKLVSAESSTYADEARAAFLAIPGHLTTKVAAGPWIRLYSFHNVPVLNAQLQTVLSLQTYAEKTGDAAASSYAQRMEQAAAATLPRFDTGYWTYYSLDGVPSPLSYSRFVLQLLQKLSPQDPRFAAARGRFATYLTQPPAFQLAEAPVGDVRFWLSKPAWVTVTVGGGRTLGLSLDGGWHTIRVGEPARAGIYGVHVTAVGPAGKRASATLLPLVSVASAPHRKSSARRKPAAAGGPTPAFAVGAGVDDAAQASQAQSLGLGLVRLTIPWQPGQTSPDPSITAELQALPPGAGLVLELDAQQLPSDDAGRGQLAQYAESLAQDAPSLRDLILTPAPGLATAAQYADALAAVRQSVRAASAATAVGPEVDGALPQPRQTVLALAAELVRDGGGAEVVAFRPAAQPVTGAWGAEDVDSLESALKKGLGAEPPVLLDAIATPTIVPASEHAAYAGGVAPSTDAVSPTMQASAYGEAIAEASCSESVSGLILDRLVDDAAAPEPATGLYWASGDAKPSARAVAQEVSDVARGAVVCPGLAAPVTATALAFPSRLGSGSAALITLGCSRDCLYLVSLLRADGRPVVAVRGSLKGGQTAQTVALPKERLAAGRYRIDVRLVSRVDPGPVTRRMSGWLSVG